MVAIHARYMYATRDCTGTGMGSEAIGYMYRTILEGGAVQLHSASVRFH
jgi:hypothetical protein